MDIQRLIAAIPADADDWSVALDEMMLSDDEYVATLADELAALLRATYGDRLASRANVRAAGFEWRDLESLYMGGVLDALDEDADSGFCVARFAPLDDVRGAL